MSERSRKWSSAFSNSTESAGHGTRQYTGVWVGHDKVCAIGIHTRGWVTMHGFALNVNTDLSAFDAIIPCGISGKGVTSISRVLGHPVDLLQTQAMCIEEFCSVLQYSQGSFHGSRSRSSRRTATSRLHSL